MAGFNLPDDFNQREFDRLWGCADVSEDLCECGHSKELHTNTDSIDDGFAVTGTRDTCKHADSCGCDGFWK